MTNSKTRVTEHSGDMTIILFVFEIERFVVVIVLKHNILCAAAGVWCKKLLILMSDVVVFL